MNYLAACADDNHTFMEKTKEHTKTGQPGQISQILERITDAFVALDKNWHFTYANSKVDEIFNRDPQKMIGRHILTEFPDIIGEPFYKACVQAMTAQQYVHLEEYYPPNDKWFESHIYPSPEGLSIFFRDVTQQKKAEEAIRQSEEKYRLLVEEADDGIFIADPYGKFLSVNTRGLQLSNYSMEELSQMTIYDLALPEDLQKYPFRLQELKEGKTVTTERPMKTKDNEIVDLEIKAKLLTDGRMLVFARDITKRKKAEEKLLFNEKQLSLIYDTVSDPLFLLQVEETKFKFLSVNHTFLTSTGLSEDQIVNRYVDEVIPQPSLDIVLKKYHEAIQTGKTVQWEEVSRYPTGSKTGIVSITPVFNNDGQCVRMVGAVHDITDLINKEKDILKEKEISDSIINSLPGVFYLYTEKGQFLRWNKNFETVTGYSADEIAKMHPLDFFEGKEKELLAEKITNVFVSGEDSVEAGFLNKEKRLIPYFFTGRTIEYENKICLMGVGIDISERVKAQDEIKHTAEQLRHLTNHLQHIREEERKHIGREIHDELGQQLTAVKMDVVWIDKNINKEATAIKSKLKNAISLLDESNLSIRRILSELRAGILDNRSLIDALKLQNRQFTINTGIPVSFSSYEPEIKIAESIADCLFRIYQEALTNITRYAKANAVKASLNLVENKIILSIEDDGEGFDIMHIKNKKSFGILGMKERAASLNGSFELTSSPGKGTRIKVGVPLN